MTLQGFLGVVSTLLGGGTSVYTITDLAQATQDLDGHASADSGARSRRTTSSTVPALKEFLMRILLVIPSLTTVAYAADQTILGKSLQVKDPKPGVDPAKRTIVGLGKEKNSPNTIVGDPTVAGAILTVFADGTTA